jgi:hypothetical protein
MNKENFSKIYAWDKMINHLSHSKDDPRSRERKRVRVALKKLGGWVEEGKSIYDREKENTEISI